MQAQCLCRATRPLEKIIHNLSKSNQQATMKYAVLNVVLIPFTPQNYASYMIDRGNFQDMDPSVVSILPLCVTGWASRCAYQLWDSPGHPVLIATNGTQHPKTPSRLSEKPDGPLMDTKSPTTGCGGDSRGCTGCQ